jgi:tetratricopeptide (TPR) repeat protein
MRERITLHATLAALAMCVALNGICGDQNDPPWPPLIKEGKASAAVAHFSQILDSISPTKLRFSPERADIAAVLPPLIRGGQGGSCGEEKPEPQPKTEKADPFDTAVKEGRELFKKKLYVESLDRFALALTLKPENREAAMLAGMAAFWARNPQRALEFWTELLDTAKRNSVEEFEIETQRVMALYAMKQVDAAETVVDRIYELRRKLPALKSVDGFVREHIFLKDPSAPADKRNEKILRIGCKEVFDERNEAQRVWIFAVVAQSEKDEPLVKRYTVESSALPGGEAGYVFVEDSSAGRRTFKRWLQKPQYPEVRTLLLHAVYGKVQPIEAPPAVAATDPAKKTPGTPDDKTPPKKLDTPEVSARIFTEQELGMAARVAQMTADPGAQQILTVAARLRETDFDVTKLTRLSLSDPQLAARYLEELKPRAPFAQEDAAELVDLISKARPEILAEAFTKLNKLGPRQPYLDYALLTGLNTRGRELAAAFLRECQKSPDLMVRQTAALMFGRAGEKKALNLLFKEVETADALVSGVLYDSLTELLGKVFPAPPPPGNDAALKEWKQTVAKWWQQNEKKVSIFQDRAASDVYFKVEGK